MLRLSKLTDYATVLLGALAADPGRMQTAAALAGATHIAGPTASKVLKALHRAGLVNSIRGLHGGYQLAKPASAISAGAILDALEGPLALTDCAVGDGHCGIQQNCRGGNSWQRVSVAIRRSLEEVSLAQLAGLDGSTQIRLPALDQAFHTSGGIRR